MFTFIKKHLDKAKLDRKISYIKDILSDYNITKYKINDDFSVDVFQDVNITDRYINIFTIKFGIINGNFMVNRIGLTSLKNCPDKITGNLICVNNNLNDLEYLPEVLGTIEFFNCNLKSLKGSPNYTNGNFLVDCNSLRSLKYSPSEVNGTFGCSKNLLTSLEYMPLEIGRHFFCTGNENLKELYSVSNIEGNIVCSDRKNLDITKFDGYCKGIIRYNNVD